MRYGILLSFITLFALAVTVSAQTQATPPIPRLEKRGTATQLIVDGKPWLSLAGELLNNAASTAAATPMASLAAVQEGRFENGAWVVGRHLAGDDTGMGGDDRASLRLTANPGILRFSLYSYR